MIKYLAMSLYDVQQRRREIALRRVNGAQVGEIISMLLRRYYILIGVAFLIAIPLSYYLIEWYMVDFSCKGPLSWWIFAVAMVITTSISLLTLIFQVYRAATTNPAVAMQSE